MKCYLDDKEIFELSDAQLKALQHPMEQAWEPEEIVSQIMQYALMKKLQEGASALFADYKPKLVEENVKDIPLLDIELCKLIFERADYKPRHQQQEAVSAQAE